MPPIFSYYGDDFTGSTDALEALASNGVETVLFLRTPSDEDLRGFSHCPAVGIAGDSRSRTPEGMREVLPGVFRRLREIGAPVVQYKVCSTFDSGPRIGSIGCALEIGQEIFGGSYVPVVAAAPLMQRFVVFGNLFAAGGGAIHRIDRHPTMKQHPVTPMDEADLVLHLARQTSRRLALINLVDLRAGVSRLPDADAVVFDGLEPRDMAAAARVIWEHRGDSQLFVVGSSGFTYGMLDYWREQGILTATAAHAALARTDRLLVLSGSCSPATQSQICRALRSGFHGIRLDPRERDWPAAEAEALDHLAAGRSVVLYSALGPADCAESQGGHALASAMGKLLRAVARASGVTRIVVAGGDTSSHAVQELGISALTFAAPLARGAPLCRAHGWGTELELVLKGGQVGSEAFFEEALSWA
jgi:uncharacterized protein YgbK (DUF1537 family)